MRNLARVCLVLAAASLASSTWAADQTVEQCIKAAQAAYENEEFDNAGKLLKQALALAEKSSQPRSAVPPILKRLSAFYVCQQRYDDAVPYALKLVEMQEKKFGSRSPQLADALRDLGIVYVRGKKLQPAEAAFKRALSIRENSPKTWYKAVALLRYELANVYRAQKNFQLADKLCEQVVADAEKGFGVKSREFVEALEAQTFNLVKQERFKDAEPFASRALKLREEFFGPNNLENIPTIITLAEIARRNGNKELSDELLVRSERLREMSWGASNADEAMRATIMVNTYLPLGMSKEVEEFINKLISSREAKLGKNHADLAYAYKNLGDLYKKLLKYKEAETAYKRSLEVFAENGRLDLRDRAAALDAYADALRKMSRESEAAKLEEQAKKQRLAQKP